jgi:hypothetical protein
MGVSLDPIVLLAAYDSQLRAYVPDPLPSGTVVERDGPLVRITGLDEGGFLTYVDLGGLDGKELDTLIARQRDFYAARGASVEWKLHGHDLPADLPGRLVAAGFEPEDRETVVVGLAAPLAERAPQLPAGVRLLEVTELADLERICAMESEVWGADRSWQAGALRREIEADPESITIVIASDGSERVVSAGWVRYVPGTGFATLWGGSTLAAFRGRGIYRALVAYRAQLAVERGFTYLQVDASDDSRPILQRLGFVAVTTTTPYVFHPGAALIP